MSDNSLFLAISSSATTIPLTAVNALPESGVVQIESELITYSACSDTSLLRCVRGAGGTTAAAHAAHKPVTFISAVESTPEVDGSVYYTETDGDTHSHQTISSDLTLLPTAGSDAGDNPKYLASAMFNVFGDSLTQAANYVAGVIGALSVTGSKASTYPVGAVLAQITDGVTEADGAVVAYIDGDSSVTTANAAFKVMHNNSNLGSGFHWGLDLNGPSHDSFNDVSFLDGEIRFSNGTFITVSGDNVTFTNAAKTESITLDLTSSLAVATFPVFAPDGTKAAPSYSFSSEHGLGLYFKNSSIFMSQGGNDILSLSSNAIAGTADNGGLFLVPTPATAAGINLPSDGLTIGFQIGPNLSLEVDGNSTATNTRLLVWDVDTGALQRVSVGANDSGGAGFRLLKIPNA